VVSESGDQAEPVATGFDCIGAGRSAAPAGTPSERAAVTATRLATLDRFVIYSHPTGAPHPDATLSIMQKVWAAQTGYSLNRPTR
jgi:hypothetical protein